MKKNQDEYKSKEYSARTSKELWITRSKKNSLISIIFFLALVLTVITLIATKNYQILVISLLISVLYYLIFMIIPLICILTKITVRTKNFDFAFQTFVYLQTVMYAFIASIHLALIYEPLPRDIKVWLGVIVYGMPFVLLVQREQFKKPIFKNESLTINNASIIIRQSIEIEEEINGFSERPIFTQYQELEEQISSPTDFKTQFEKYCVFIGKKGELIDWNVTEDRAILYPRFLIRSPNIIKSPFRFINFMKAVRSKTNLTTIEICYPSKQLFIKVAFSEYSVLNREVTFHYLALRILETFKLSATAFFSNDLESTYSLLINMSE